mgnify:FL=1
MIHLDGSFISSLMIHRVGNKSLEEGFKLTDKPIRTDPELMAVLRPYFTSMLSGDELFSFTNEVNLDQNEVYHLARKIFAEPSSLAEHSKAITAHLYNQSTHPRIKSGELYVAYFEEVVIDDEVTSAIGIFKSESRETFLQVDFSSELAGISHFEGIPARRPDKACMIFNVASNEGFRVAIFDHLNRTSEAGFWRDDFLNLKPVGTDFYQTNYMLDVTKQFVTKRYVEEHEPSKVDQIELLNRSVDYFKNNETFDRGEFCTAVFDDKDVRTSFLKFEEQQQSEGKMRADETFSISLPAVKKQSRSIRSIIKLDRNFHIYVHGDKDLIQQGVDENGRKYYKIYYETES